jgi:hypothetical protein
MLQDMVKHLTTREATILRYRFGLDGGTEKTLEEVGVKFGVTRERVRQIQNLALRKLRKMIEKLEKKKAGRILIYAEPVTRRNRRRHPQRPGFSQARHPVQGHHARLADARLFAGAIDLLTGKIQAGLDMDAVVGIDARGFIFAAAAATRN